MLALRVEALLWCVLFLHKKCPLSATGVCRALHVYKALKSSAGTAFPRTMLPLSTRYAFDSCREPRLITDKPNDSPLSSYIDYRFLEYF